MNSTTKDLIEFSQYAICVGALRVIDHEINDSQGRPGRQHQETSMLLGRLQQELFGLALGFCIESARKRDYRGVNFVVAQRRIQHAVAGDGRHGLKIRLPQVGCTSEGARGLRRHLRRRRQVLPSTTLRACAKVAMNRPETRTVPQKQNRKQRGERAIRQHCRAIPSTRRCRAWLPADSAG